MQLGDPDWDWRTASLRTRIVAAACFVGWFGALASMLVGGYIDTDALQQPDFAIGIYQHPHKVKGVVRFLTDQQYEIGSILAWTSIGSWGLVLVSWPMFHWLTLKERPPRGLS